MKNQIENTDTLLQKATKTVKQVYQEATSKKEDEMKSVI